MDITNRIKKVIEYYDMNNSMFERKCGLSNGYVRKLKGNIGNEKLNQILKSFPEINPEWMVHGLGEMIIKSSTKVQEIASPNNTTEPNLIPIYDLDFSCGDMRRETNEEHIIGGLSLPNIRKDAVIITATGDSMSPTINNGDRIILHQVNSWAYFNYGAVYGIVTEEYRLIKRVRKHPSDKNLVLLRSENAEYDDIELPIADIRELFSVDGVFRINML